MELPAALINTGVEALFFILLLVFTLHAVVLGYHWFTYGASRKTSMISLCTYLSGGAVLLLILSTSFLL